MSRLTASQFNNIVGDMSGLPFTKRITLPATEKSAPNSQWAKDSHRLDLILHCKHHTEDGPANCADQFTHVPTSRGICSAFNAPPLADVMRTESSHWLQMFERYYRTDGRPELFLSVAPGALYEMRLVLDMHGREIRNGSKGVFHIQLNEAVGFVDAASASLSLRPGQKMEVNVEAKVYAASESFSELSEDVR